MPIFTRRLFLPLILAAAPAFAAHAAPAIDTAQLAAGEKVFAQCKACHAIEKGKADGVGPNLYGVYGSKAGTHSATFKYSAAMKASGQTWNDATLNSFLLAPMKAVPGTKMTYGGVKDDTKRAALVYYLKARSAE
ncbi:c-type cytochrome [Asticcacaulis taihuensis]|uniref:c-type cytochrome n=1 Tax=Asticcacaulis taihuensis TaxID=260084 RepID=UPI003F7C0C15